MEEASISTLKSFHAIVSDTIWSFATFLESSKTWINLDTNTIQAPPPDKARSFWTRKGGTILHESALRLTKILPVADSKSFFHFSQVSKMYLKTLDDPVGNELVELEVSTESTPEEGPNNNTRQHTIRFQYPINRYYYVALTVASFQGILCDWYGIVHNCFLLNAKSICDTFTTFDGNMTFNKLYESDEENGSDERTVSVFNSANRQVHVQRIFVGSIDKSEASQLSLI